MSDGRESSSGSEAGGPAPDASDCHGLFHDREALEEAVRALGRAGVPADSIRVHLLDRDGERTRELEVQEEAGTMRGALVGAAAGAVIGVVLVALIPAGAFGSVPGELLTSGSVAGAVGAVLALAAAGVPLGALLGMGRWRGGHRVSRSELEEGSVLVSVTNQALAPTAREVLRDAGAEPAGGSR